MKMFRQLKRCWLNSLFQGRVVLVDFLNTLNNRKLFCTSSRTPDGFDHICIFKFSFHFFSIFFGMFTFLFCTPTTTILCFRFFRTKILLSVLFSIFSQFTFLQSRGFFFLIPNCYPLAIYTHANLDRQFAKKITKNSKQ